MAVATMINLEVTPKAFDQIIANKIFTFHFLGVAARDLLIISKDGPVAPLLNELILKAGNHTVQGMTNEGHNVTCPLNILLTTSQVIEKQKVED